MTDAPDTTEERLAEYRRLFGTDLIGRQRTERGIQFRFRARDGLAAEIRDLAAREKACCAFFSFEITEHGDEITWDASVIDDPIARRILDEYYALPDTLDASTAELFERFAGQGLEIVIDDDGTHAAGDRRRPRRVAAGSTAMTGSAPPVLRAAAG